MIFDTQSKQEKRLIWLFILLLALCMLFIAHGFFQNYLFMRPCEQCVYIRFAVFAIALGAFFAFLNPKNIFLKFIAFVLAFYGVIYGIEHALILQKAYEAVLSMNLFGGVTCKEIPSFAFDLALHEWLEDLFKPSGICGFDYPIVPEDANLSTLQEFFVGTKEGNFKNGLYSEGWYLLPSLKFINMPTAVLIILIFIALILLILFLKFSFENKAVLFFISCIICVALLVFLS
ncbi:protein-disulfide oxidoreductase DsbI [Campylobacter sp. MIT 99-7217]|uniref:protein-disulfide oxidoreductase DsbI n=1 Tax=Campylobacter sp. MIT 99-7217 TaxID=535091 RepID=UPI001158565E|nr:protein-disulfide oxidoreductase DsbI [Campylobacter sp. MIT 99-7217]TQR34585.1 protein-disulfide oxidoreductase DsbI [Campylobacter sp. MIT 99-7217]